MKAGSKKSAISANIFFGSLWLFLLFFATLPALSKDLIDFRPAGGGGAVGSVNGKTGNVVLNGTDLKVTATSSTNIATSLSVKVDSQFTAADDYKVLTVDPVDHKVRPMATAASAVRFYHVFPSTGAAIDVGEAGYAVASRGDKSLMFTFDQNGSATPFSNAGDSIVLSYDRGPKKLIVSGDTADEYFLTIITE